VPLLDTLSRPLRNLRLSVTDRCNLRCQYCMPEDDYVWLPREDVLHFEEISVLVDVFLSLGVDKLRLTGGEPLLRRDLASLVRMLSVKAGLNDLAMTTNGVLLAEQIDGLKAAGLRRITVSLDTLKADRFVALARFDELARVKEGLEAASRAFSASREALPSGSPGLKIDSVAIKGVNDDELVDLIEYGKTLNAEVRFIEYMDVGGATRWTAAGVISRREMLDRLAAHYGPVESLANESSAPADQFRLPDGTVFGIISSTTEPFCRSCDRSRLTADGMWYLCLYASRGTDLRAAIRNGASADELRAIITDGWTNRSDRGAEVRLALGDRRASAQVIPVKSLRQDPHLEMHTRGG
jgi:cyclic pyranopterin phosphate synthase